MKSVSTLVFLLSIYVVYGDKKSDIQKLKSILHLLQAKYNMLEERVELQSSFCAIHAYGKCGTCVCKDDFNIQKKYYCDCRNQPPKRDCLAHRKNGMPIDGYYTVTMNGYRTFDVYCDQTTAGGGWTVIQRRMDGSVNFYKRWDEYKIGFGELHREFWLGNDNIHLLTLQTVYPKGSELMINMRLHGNSGYHTNRFSHFQVDSRRSNYLLHVSGPSGNLSPSLFTSYQNKVEFSTWDRDRDGAPSYNCARDYLFSGWWINGEGNSCTSYKAAGHNLNGPYDKYRQRSWYNRINTYSTLQPTFVEMKVRRL